MTISPRSSQEADDRKALGILAQIHDRTQAAIDDELARGHNAREHAIRQWRRELVRISETWN